MGMNIPVSILFILNYKETENKFSIKPLKKSSCCFHFSAVKLQYFYDFAWKFYCPFYHYPDYFFSYILLNFDAVALYPT